MDTQQKLQLKSELTMIKSLSSAVNSQIAVLGTSAYPVAGNTVNITALPMAAQAIRTQNDILVKLMDLLDKVLEAA